MLGSRRLQTLGEGCLVGRIRRKGWRKDGHENIEADHYGGKGGGQVFAKLLSDAENTARGQVSLQGYGVSNIAHGFTLELDFRVQKCINNVHDQVCGHVSERIQHDGALDHHVVP